MIRADAKHLVNISHSGHAVPGCPNDGANELDKDATADGFSSSPSIQHNAAMVLRAEDVVRSRADVIRPLIHHLNNDNTWLLQIPRAKGPRLFYNILIDPWLAGPDINFFAFFHEQHHGEESAAKDIAEVEKFLGDIERLARKYRDDASVSEDKPTPISFIDVVSVSI
jgi:hypothetical protein